MVKWGSPCLFVTDFLGCGKLSGFGLLGKLKEGLCNSLMCIGSDGATNSLVLRDPRPQPTGDIDCIHQGSLSLIPELWREGDEDGIEKDWYLLSNDEKWLF